MTIRLAAFLLVISTPAAQALSCALVPLEQRIEAIVQAQAEPAQAAGNTPALGIGILSQPVQPICNDTDWTGNVICAATLSFTGTLYTADHATDVSNQPVKTTFYEAVLGSTSTHPQDMWLPWLDTPWLMEFTAPTNGPLQFWAIDNCANHRIAPSTPELRGALAACHAENACPGRARIHLASLNLSVF
jgi:hypothetical protein